MTKMKTKMMCRRSRAAMCGATLRAAVPSQFANLIG